MAGGGFDAEGSIVTLAVPLKPVPKVLRFVLFALACSLAVLGAEGDPGAEIRRVVDEEMAANGVPGAVVGVWRGGRPVAVFARGFSDVAGNVPMSVADHFRIASITKTFTTTRVLQLQEAGLLSLSDPIGKYIPGLVNGSATLRQLGDMTAGFFNYTHDPVFAAELPANPLRVWSAAELVALANAHGPRFAPGTSWEYSNTNTLLLQMVVEQVTGNSLAVEFQNAFFTPLSLASSSYPASADLPLPHAHGHMVLPDGGGALDISAIDPSIAQGAGAIVATLADVGTWIEALGSGDLLSAESQAERLVMNPAGEGYDAYGFGIARIGDWIGHDGVFPGFQSVALYDPALDQSIVILANSTFAGSDYHFPDAVAEKITPLLVPEPSVGGLLAVFGAAAAFAAWGRRGKAG